MPLPELVSRNGQLIAPSQAQVSIFNPALYGAYGVYESLQVVQGIPFALAPHLERLAHSAAAIGLPLPDDPQTIGEWAMEALQANGARDCILRLFVLGPENGGEPAAYLWPQPAPVYPEIYYAQGVAAVTFEGQRALPTAKTLNTLVSFLAGRKAQAAGAHEGLLHYGGHFTEGGSSNLFAVVDGEILTAPDGEVLSGVVRDVVFTLAAHADLPLRQAPVAVAGLSRWTECFITSTSRHIMPVTAVDGRPVGNGRVGPMTRRLMDLFEAYFRGTLEETAGTPGRG